MTTFISTLRMGPGKRPGKQKTARFGLRGSAASPKERLRLGVDHIAQWSDIRAESRGFGTPAIPETAESPPLYASCCFPPASPAFASGTGKQKRPRRAVLIFLKSLRDFGAGEGIRTLDPNLGKVIIGLR
jgi:hypothetical protein